MFKKITFIIIFVITFITSAIHPYATINDAPSLTTVHSALIMDADTGNVLYSLNGNDKVYPASTTKIMTILLAIENLNLNDTITMSYAATHELEFGSSHIALNENEKITVEQALYATSITSANDAANGLAEAVSGSLDEFAKLMTKKAKELGANNTNFVNANGLHDPNHYTTPYDLALIMKEGIKYDSFLKFLSSTYYEIPPTNITNETRYLHGTNRSLLEDTDQYVPGILASKTGYTVEAGQTQVSYASKDDKNIIVTVFGGNDKIGRYNDTKTLFNYAFTHYTALATNTLPLDIPTISPPKNYLFKNKNYYSINVPDHILVYNDTNEYPVTTKISTDTITKDTKVGSVIGNIDFIQDDHVITSSNITLLSPLKKDLSIPILLLKIIIILFILLICLRQYYKFKRKIKKYRPR